MLTVHHLRISQSERIIWLCEELGIPYVLRLYDREPHTRLAPAPLRALHPTGAAPVIEDDGVTLGESGAIVEYIIAKHGGGRLAHGPAHPDFAAYLYWFHFSNGTFQPAIMRDAVLRFAGVAPDNPMAAIARERLMRAYAMIEARLSDTPYLAGADFTAADIMIDFSLTTMQHFAPIDQSPYKHIAAYLARLAARGAYRAMREKA